MSSGSSTRPKGMWSRMRYIGCSGFSKMGSLVAGERIIPGLMQFTRMPWRAPSAARTPCAQPGTALASR
jgi:hypothetical protein